MQKHLFAAMVCWGMACSAFAQEPGQAPTGPAVSSQVKEESSNNPAPLPKSLRGRWSNPASGHSDLIEIEVLEMTTPRDGKALVTFWPYCRKSETPVVFERKLNVWRFTATNCSGRTDQFHMRVRPIEGKNRMEGWYDRENSGKTVYLEWKE